MSASGPTRGTKTRSYHSPPRLATSVRRVRYPARSGMPRKISTLFAMAHIVTSTTAVCAPNQPGTTVRKSQPSTLYVRIWKIELSATRTAASSPDPQARVFQMSTMAMHRASPISTRPLRYAGRSGRNSHARANITIGPTIQLSTSEVPMSLRSATCSPIVSYFTFARTGYIITSRPIAIGTDTPATRTLSSTAPRPGKARPSISPTAMATKIQTGRNRSSVERRLTTGATVTCSRNQVRSTPPSRRRATGRSSRRRASCRERTR